MSRPRRFLFLSVAAVVVGLVVAGWAVWPRPSAITRENVERIQDGMTLAEVEAILGGPARDDSTGALASATQPRDNDAEVTFHPLIIDLMFGKNTPRPLEWRSDEVVLLVQFDAEGRVMLRHWVFTRRLYEGRPLDRLRRWLGL